MSYQRCFLSLNLTLFLLGIGATVECRAEGIAMPRAVPDLHSASLFPCPVNLSSCVSAVQSSRVSAHHSGQQNSIKLHPSQSASGWRGTNAGWQTSDRPMFGRNAAFSAASTEADTDGRFALKVALDSHYHGAVYNIQAPLEPMQISLNYIRSW